MKKTLIALMALAGVAAANTEAITLSEATIKAAFTSAPVLAGNCYSGDYSFEFTLSEYYTLKNSGAVLGFYRGSAVNDTYGYNAIVLSETDGGALTLTVGRGRANNTLDNATGIGVGTTFTFADKAAFSTTISKGVTYTLTVTGDAGMMTPTLTWEGGSETLTAYKSNMNGNAALTAVVNPGITVTIPEPATATLSLLALAGLAARRRRK